YADYQEMLDKEHLDLVSICTWPQLHAPMTIAAAHAGARGILCEKPMALTLSEANAMLDACRRNGARLSVDHQRRLGEPFRVAKEMAQGGDIGELIRVEAHVSDSNLYDWGPHLIDLMFYFFDDVPAEWVMAQVEGAGSRTAWGLPVERHAI